MSQVSTALPQSAPSHRFALAALILGGAAIGGSPIFVRLSEVGPMATGFWRVALAFFPIYVFSLIKGGATGPKPETWTDRCLLILPGVILAVDLITWHLSITITSVANATLLANLAPVFVTIIGVLFMGAAVTRVFVLGLVLAIVGVVVLKGGPAALGQGDLRGDGGAVLAAVAYALYILAIGRLRTRFDTVRIMLWSTASAAVCLFPFGFFVEGHLMPTTAYGWAMVFGLARRIDRIAQRAELDGAVIVSNEGGDDLLVGGIDAAVPREPVLAVERCRAERRGQLTLQLRDLFVDLRLVDAIFESRDQLRLHLRHHIDRGGNCLVGRVENGAAQPQRVLDR